MKFFPKTSLDFNVTGRLSGSVAQWSECSHGMREVLGSSPGRAMCFFLPCDSWWPVWVHAQAGSSKGTVSSVPAWFRADSGTNLIKQGEIVTGRPCGPIAQWSECSHGVREILGSSLGRAMHWQVEIKEEDKDDRLRQKFWRGH